MVAQFFKLPITHRTRTDDLPGVTGTARLDPKTKNLIKRLSPGDIAIIDHRDLDRLSAEGLIERQVGAVVNVAASISGRYPNHGPQLLLEAGIPLLDEAGPDLFSRVSEGTRVRLHGQGLYVGEEIVAKGRLQTAESVQSAMIEAKAGAATQLQAFVANTLEYMTKEGGLLVDGIAVPQLRTRFEGRHVLVVVRGHHHREDLATLRSYIREFKPLMVGVDGGADTLLDRGRAGFSSTFLTRLRVGGKLVDAKGVSRLYRPRVSAWALTALVLAASITVLIVLAISPAGQVLRRDLLTQWDVVRYWISGLF